MVEIKSLMIFLGGKSILVREIKEARGLMIFKGLMFSNKDNSKALLFNIQGSIHSFFVFFPFLVLWLDNKNKILEWKIVKPFSIYEKSEKKFFKILEIPISRRYFKVVNFIVGERFKN